MAVAIVSSSIPPTGPTLLDPRNKDVRNGTEKTRKDMNATKPPPVPRGKRERPCDACRKRKSKCVITEGQKTCAACSVHGQECTYVEDPRPRKRRIDIDGRTTDPSKRRSAVSPTSDISSNSSMARLDSRTVQPAEDRDGSIASTSASHNSASQNYGTHIGPTTELEPILLDLSTDTDLLSTSETYQTRGRAAFLVDQPAIEKSRATSSLAVKSVEAIAGSYGPALLDAYRRVVHYSFPILEESFFEDYEAGHSSNLDPALLAAMFALMTPWIVEDHPGHTGLPDAAALEELAFTLFTESVYTPTLSTIQTGILLMQRPDIDSKTLNTRLVGAAHELGLQVDSSQWALSTSANGLRKRLAWALYMQDKWCSLIHGRPSAIANNNWAVQDLEDEDFEPPSGETEYESNWEVGVSIFKQMVRLTEVLSTVLDTFYTLKAMQEVEDAAQNGTRLILDRAKPVQIKLKEWFGGLPADLKMDVASDGRPCSTGYMHLAYFATEITLHRCIIRSLQTSNSDTYLTHICRSAAKTRLISAMDFVNRLRPENLCAFWYFPSRVSFALIGTFGGLLLATAPGQEEVDFYRVRLGEYRWTLGVSSHRASFLGFAAESLDASEALLKNLPRRPSTSEIAARSSAARAEEVVQSLSPPREEGGEDVEMRGGLGDLSVLEEEGVDEAGMSEAGVSGLVSPSTSEGSMAGFEMFMEAFKGVKRGEVG